jgi:hypothetical protein
VPGFKQTDWDAYSNGGTLGDIRTPYITGYAGQLDAVKDARFLKRDLWFHRFIVSNARTREYELYDELGGFQRTLPQDGHIVFDNSADVPHSSAPIESVVDVLPQLPTLQHKLPAGIGSDQVPVVKETLGI